MRSAGRAESLIDALSKAANAARDPERQAALWLAVAEVHEHRPNGFGAAVAALKRVLKASADHVEAHRALARIYRANAQWSEAATALETLLRLEITPAERPDVLLELAILWEERLASPDKARSAVLSALDIAPANAAARRHLAKQQLRAGETDAAEATARALSEAAAGEAERAQTLVLLAAVARKRGNAAAAEQALTEAIAIEGAAGEAAAEFQRTAASGASWVTFAGAVNAHIRGDSAQAEKVTSYLALAATYGDRMSLPGKAIEVLQEGLAIARGDRRLTDDLLRRLRVAGQPEGAAERIQQLLERGERQTELWRALARVYRDMGRPGDARLAASALVALGDATQEELELIRVAPPRPGRAPGGLLRAPWRWRRWQWSAPLHCPPARSSPRAPNASRRSSRPTSRDSGCPGRIASRRGNAHPLRARIDELCAIFNVECDAYVHGGSAPMVTIGLTDPVSVIVERTSRSLPEAQQVFLLSRAIAAVSLGVHPALLMPAQDLERILAAATRAVLSDFGGPNPQIDDLAHRIRKAQSRRWRKAQETAAADYAAAPLADAKSWQRAIARTLNRAAALLADDLAAAVTGLAVCDRRAQWNHVERPAHPSRRRRSVAVLDVRTGSASPHTFGARARAVARSVSSRSSRFRRWPPPQTTAPRNAGTRSLNAMRRCHAAGARNLAASRRPTPTAMASSRCMSGACRTPSRLALAAAAVAVIGGCNARSVAPGSIDGGSLADAGTDLGAGGSVGTGGAGGNGGAGGDPSASKRPRAAPSSRDRSRSTTPRTPPRHRLTAASPAR